MSVEAKLATGFGVALLVLSILATALGFREVQLSSTSFDEIGTLLLALSLVALVIERAVEVYVSKRYDPEKLRLRRPLTRAEAKLSKAEKSPRRGKGTPPWLLSYPVSRGPTVHGPACKGTP